MEQVYRDAETIARLRSGALGTYIDEFVQQLHNDGYPTATIHLHVRCAVNFANWLRKNRKGLLDVTDGDRRAYAKYRKRKGYAPCSVAVLQRLANLIAGRSETARVRCRTSQAKSVVPGGYVGYLQNERALSQATITRNVLIVETFLRSRFNGDVELSEICPTDVYEFLRIEASRCPAYAGSVTSAIRSFLRYLFYAGILQENYADTVPYVARWSNSSIPKSLPAESVHEVLKQSDTSSRIGRRDYAILLLLARLGLRARRRSGITKTR